MTTHSGYVKLRKDVYKRQYRKYTKIKNNLFERIGLIIPCLLYTSGKARKKEAGEEAARAQTKVGGRGAGGQYGAFRRAGRTALLLLVKGVFAW